MTLPVFTPSISAEMRAIITAKLAEIEAEHGVRILFAIESGSRAWGFPSPDSDYDVRFVYAHEPDWYLSLKPGRDVIELPISDELDIGGWDLRKALNLLLRANPVLLEWLSSPIRYLWQEGPTAELIALAEKVTFGTASRHHYLNLGEGQWARHIADQTEVNAKKYFYILRPALALRWLRLNPDVLPPMNLQALVAGLDLPDETVREIADLVTRKAELSEIGTGPRIAVIDTLIAEEFALAKAAKSPAEKRVLAPQAEALFRRIVKGAL